MPKQKDLKRLTRARMQKTGESYTAARATLLAKKARQSSSRVDGRPEPPRGSAATPRAPEPAGYAALAGMSDAAVREKTGCDWKRWVEALDYRGAASWSHREIAAYVHETFDVSGWWAQMVTVGYERIKGLRAIGQRRSGEFEASKSKTVPVPVERLRRAFTDRRLRARWLPGVEPTVRKTTSKKSVRWTWEDGTPVVAWFEPKGEAKSLVAVVHQRLADRDEVEAKKAYWGERLNAMAAMLKA